VWFETLCGGLSRLASSWLEALVPRVTCSCVWSLVGFDAAAPLMVGRHLLPSPLRPLLYSGGGLAWFLHLHCWVRTAAATVAAAALVGAAV